MKRIKKLLLILCSLQVSLWSSLLSKSEHTARDVTFEDLFLRANLDSVDEIDSLNKKCIDLNLALSFEFDLRTHERTTYLTVRGSKIPIPQKLLEKIYALILQENTYNNKTAYVRVCDQSTSVGYEEKKIAAQRLTVCQKNIEKLLGKKITDAQTPRIAVCCSGGGVRAAISTSGFLYGLEQEQLLDTVLYASALSGGTWALGSWMYSPDSLCDFYPACIKRIAEGFVHTSPREGLNELKNSLPTLANYLLKKLIYKEIPSVIDIYGYCLALTFFDQKLKDHYLTVDLADQQTFLQNGQRPIPLYAAIIPHNGQKEYSWLTFSPFEVTNTDFYAAVPTWSYGRKFNKGVSTTFAPPLTGGFLLGVWGSAISVSCEEFYNLVLDNLEPKAVFAPLKKLIQAMNIGDVRLFDAQIRNVTYGISQFPYATEKRTSVVDAGIDINLPLPPLLTTDRKVDIIIICDASGDVVGAPELKCAETWARENNIPFPKINYQGITDRPYTIFDDGKGSHTPIIIYIPMVYNPKYSTLFDPQESMGFGQFLHTFNFDYSEPQALTLSGLFVEAVHELKTDLIKIIQTVIDRKA